MKKFNFLSISSSGSRKRPFSYRSRIKPVLFPYRSRIVLLSPDFVIAYPKKYKSYNFSRQECKKQGFSRIGGRACYFTRLFARLPKQQKQPLIIKHLQTYFEKVTKSGKSLISYQSLRVGVGKDRSRIGLVSNPYCFRIDPVSFSYRSPIVLLSFSLPEAETIRKQYGNNTRSIYAGREDDT